MSKLSLAAILFFIFSCGQTEVKVSNNKAVPDSPVNKQTLPEANRQILPEMTVRILWRDNMYDSTLKDSFNAIVLNDAYCKTMPDAAKAAVGYAATFIGNECWWDGDANDDRSNLKCKVLTALDLGYQCSDKHLGFLRQWFSTDKKVLEHLQDCPTKPYTATVQDTFDEIKLTMKADSIMVWFEAHGVNVREGKSWSWTETDHFQVTGNKIKLVKVDKSKLKHEEFENGE